MTTLFVSPHFDDVVLSCPAHVVDAGRHGRVIVATAFGHNQDARRAEDARALALLGAEALPLPFSDAPERLGIEPGLRSLLLTRYDREAEDRAALIAALRPLLAAASVTHLVLPLGVGGHVDHRIVHGLYDAWPHAVSVSFFEDEPYARVRGAIQARLGEIGAQPAGALSPNVTPADVRASAQAVFGSLLARTRPLEDADAITTLAHRLAAPTRSGDGRVGPLLTHDVPTVPALADAALSCYASQLADWFPSDEVRRAFVKRSVTERTWRYAGASVAP